MPRDLDLDRDPLTYLVCVEGKDEHAFGYIVDAYPEELARYRRDNLRHMVGETPCPVIAETMLESAMRRLCDRLNRRAALGRRG